MNLGGNIKFFEKEEDFNDSVAQEIVSNMTKFQESNGVFNFGLSGGNSPLGIFDSMIRMTKADAIKWEKTHFFWIDERGVAPDHQDSNFGVAFNYFLKDHDVGGLYRMKGELDPRIAAEKYESTLVEKLPLNDKGVPMLDVALIGMGIDGHVASIFPQSSALSSTGWVYGDFIENVGMNRITLTLPALNAVRKRIFIIKGQEKLNLLKEMADLESYKYPMQYLLNRNEKDLWFIKN